MDEEELAREVKALKAEEAQQEQARQTSEKKEETQKAAGDSSDKKSSEKDVSDEQVKDLEKEIEQKNEQSYLTWAGSKVTQAGNKAKAQWSSTIPSVGGKSSNAASDTGKESSPAGQDTYKDMKARSDARQAAVYEGT